MSKLISHLKKVVGESSVLTACEDLSVYECDGESLDLARPDIVVLPSSTAEVQAVIKLANQFNQPVVPRGAGTGLSGGATAVMGGICLVLTRMTKITEVDPVNLTATVQAGATNSSISQAAKKHKLYYAPDPSSQIASTIGGNIAENAGGPHTLKYGTTVSHVSGVKMVLPDGSIATLGGKSRDNLGLDLLSIVVGSEGTLGIVTEAIVKLLPLPEKVETILAYFPSLNSGGNAVSSIIACGVIPAAMEMMDQLTLQTVEASLSLGLDTEAQALLLIEIDGNAATIAHHKEIVLACIAQHNAKKVFVAANNEERNLFWKARKSALSSLGRIAPCGYVLDGVIPRSRLSEAIVEINNIAKKYQLIIANVYHAGDGNLHPCLLYRSDNISEVKNVLLAAKEILSMCVGLGGALSGEHGIGVEKVEQMSLLFSTAELQAMRNIKDAFDPEGRFNPGKILPNLKGCGESGKRPLLRHILSLN